jgi:hypothetical protein
VHSGSAPASISRSVCETLRETIEETLDDGLSAKRIHQDLVAEKSFLCLFLLVHAERAHAERAHAERAG